MEFSYPYISILGFICFIAWSVGFLKIGKKPEVYVPSSIPVKRKLAAKSLAFLFGMIAWVSLTISAMGPKESIGYDSNKIEIADIYLVFDVSRSMLAEDFQPNRLEAAKSIMIEYVDMAPQARLGVVMFSERVFTLIPLTTDLDLVKQSIAEIDIGFLGSGTNIGDGLALATGRLALSEAQSKVIILLTDGVNNVGSMTPLQAADTASKNNIKIYAIGIGGDEDARIPLPGDFMGRRRYQTIPGGSIDEENLREISTMTGGQHWMATETDTLRNVFKEIERLERTEVDSSSRVIYKEIYLKFLAIGLIMLLTVEAFKRLWLREVL